MDSNEKEAHAPQANNVLCKCTEKSQCINIKSLTNTKPRDFSLFYE